MKQELIYQAILSTLAHEATDEEQKIVDEWLRESEENREEYEGMRRMYEKATAPRKPKQFDADRAWKQVADHTIYKKQSWYLSTWVRYAAVVAVVVASGLFFITDWFRADSPDGIDMMAYNEPTLLLEGGDEIDLSGQSFTMKRDQALIKNDADNLLSYEAEGGTDKAKIVHNRLIIPRGKTYRLVLEDGTKVWLNSETELSYPSRFAGTKREVMLLGEAFFEVTPDKERPFYVKANGMDIRVLGTSFNVSAYQDSESTSTTLVEGSVAVSMANGAERTITPSERLAYNKKSHQLSVEKVDTELYTSWINGKFKFRDMRLEDIMKKVNRWYNCQIRFEDPSVKELRFSGAAERDRPVEYLLELIQKVTEVNFEIENKTIVLMHK